MKKFLSITLCFLLGTFVFANGVSYSSEINMLQNEDGSYLTWETLSYGDHKELVVNYFVVDPKPYDEGECLNCIREFMSKKFWTKAISTKELRWSIRYNRRGMDQTYGILPAGATVTNFCIHYSIEG